MTGAWIVEALPLAASMAAVAGAQGLRAGRRRGALNEALHELRRPLQAIALASGSPRRAGPPAIEGSLELAAMALERLDREINGGGAPASAALEAVSLRPLLEAAVARWRPRVGFVGGSLELRWQAGRARVEGDRCGLAQALDNLIVNAIEHGGPEVVVRAWRQGRWLRVSVYDSGRAAAGEGGRRGGAGAALARLSGRRRHGHGLGVVRRVAAAHGGRFALRRAGRGARAVLDLPVASGAACPA